MIIVNILTIMTSDTSSSREKTTHIDMYDVDESLPMLMATCVKYMRESLHIRFSDMGNPFTSEQWLLLTHLATRDGVTQKNLASRSNRTEVAVLNLLNKLEKDDLVVRRRDPVDGRCKRVYLTVKGRKLQRELIPSAKENISQMCKDISNDDIQLLKKTIHKITNNLKR